MIDLGSLWYFLGIEVAYSPKSYFLSHLKFIADILKRAKLTDNKIVDTLIKFNIEYSFLMIYLCQILLYTVLLLVACYISLSLVQILHMLFMFVASPTTVH